MSLFFICRDPNEHRDFGEGPTLGHAYAEYQNETQGPVLPPERLEWLVCKPIAINHTNRIDIAASTYN